MKTNFIYISGAITGIDNWENQFDEAEKKIYKDCKNPVQVINPRRLSNEVNALFKILNAIPEYADYLRYDIKKLIDCNTIYMLKGWSKSKGACLEYQIAKTLGLKIIGAEK